MDKRLLLTPPEKMTAEQKAEAWRTHVWDELRLEWVPNAPSVILPPPHV